MPNPDQPTLFLPSRPRRNQGSARRRPRVESQQESTTILWESAVTPATPVEISVIHRPRSVPRRALLQPHRAGFDSTVTPASFLQEWLSERFLQQQISILTPAGRAAGELIHVDALAATLRSEMGERLIPLVNIISVSQ